MSLMVHGIATLVKYIYFVLQTQIFRYEIIDLFISFISYCGQNQGWNAGHGLFLSRLSRRSNGTMYGTSSFHRKSLQSEMQGTQPDIEMNIVIDFFELY